jgi:hypothetical protein
MQNAAHEIENPSLMAETLTRIARLNNQGKPKCNAITRKYWPPLCRPATWRAYAIAAVQRGNSEQSGAAAGDLIASDKSSLSAMVSPA